MSEIKEGWHGFGEACLDTPFNAPCVKKHGSRIDMPEKYDHGILVQPSIDRRALKSVMALNSLVAEMNPATVIVRGHGWAGEVPFVWTGSAAEFNQTWEVD